MKQNNKTCICCGEIYTFCTGCGQFDNEPRWKAIYHNETCKDIFIIVSDYLQKAISKEEAKNRLLKCDLSYKEKLHKKIQEGIDELLYEEKASEVMQLSEPVKSDNVKSNDVKTETSNSVKTASTQNCNYTKMKYQNQKKKKN